MVRGVMQRASSDAQRRASGRDRTWPRDAVAGRLTRGTRRWRRWRGRLPTPCACRCAGGSPLRQPPFHSHPHNHVRGVASRGHHDGRSLVAARPGPPKRSERRGRGRCAAGGGTLTSEEVNSAGRPQRDDGERLQDAADLPRKAVAPKTTGRVLPPTATPAATAGNSSNPATPTSPTGQSCCALHRRVQATSRAVRPGQTTSRRTSGNRRPSRMRGTGRWNHNC